MKEKQQEEMSNKEKVERNKKELQSHLKSLQTFMGGTVTKGQAQDAYKYITSGKMAEDIWKSHDNASEVAMFMLFKDKFAKILRSQGLEDGKAKILNEIIEKFPNVDMSILFFLITGPILFKYALTNAKFSLGVIFSDNDVKDLNSKDFGDEDLKVKFKDYYFSNVIARSSKTMLDCNNSKIDIKRTGTEG